MKGLPNLRVLAFCNLTSFNILFLKEFEIQVQQMHPPAAKTVAWVQHLLLHYLFTYTYLFSLNIISSNLLSACNKDDKLRDQQQLFFKIFSRICLLIYPHSSFLLNRQRFSFQFFFRFFDHIKCKDTNPFFYLP